MLTAERGFGDTPDLALRPEQRQTHRQSEEQQQR